ncbi:SDR family oxidoreductase [Paenibacillus sp. P26]|nr:SDR family oxidoreductase [Paenibacillus sp. P26]
MNLQGRIAIVTGGARGIGRAASKSLARQGAKVVVNYVSNGAAAEETVGEITAQGGEAVAIRADVRDPQEISSLVEETKRVFGGRVDILVSNANIGFPVKPFMEVSWDEFAQKLNGELKAAFTVTQAVIPAMVEQKYGRIVYVSSGSSKHATPNFIAHGTAKGGLDSFARYIAGEFGPYGITANVVAPGMTETDAVAQTPGTEHMKEALAQMTPLRRIAQPEDIGDVIAFLASDASRFVTGSYTPVNGGMMME